MIWIGAAGVLAFSAVGCVDRKAQAQSKETEKIVSDPVQVVSAQPVGLQTMVESVEITGSVTTSLETQVAAKIPGRLTGVSVREGDSVAVGQVLATLDNTNQLAAVQQAFATMQQAQAGLASAQSQLAQATSNAALSPARTSAAVRQAEAQLRSARANLLKAQNGARPEERRQAEAAAQSARTNLANAQKELARLQTLVTAGAVAANRLDQQTTAVAAAQAQYEQTQQNLNIIRNGTRAEDIAAVRAAVQQAEEGVRSAKAQKSLDVLLIDQVNTAKAQVASARAQVQSAQAAVAIAQQNLAETVIRAPYNGRVQGKPEQVGTVVSPGTPIVQLIGGEGIYFSGQVPADRIDRLRQGSPVTVTIDAIPGKKFAGRIAGISPQGSTVGRQFDVRVAIAGDISQVKPGMFARGQVQLNVVAGATVVPVTSVVEGDNVKYIFVVDGDKAKRIPVQTGLTSGQVIQVTGVPAGAQVIVEGQTNLADGSKIRLNAAAEKSAMGSQASARG